MSLYGGDEGPKHLFHCSISSKPALNPRRLPTWGSGVCSRWCSNLGGLFHALPLLRTSLGEPLLAWLGAISVPRPHFTLPDLRLCRRHTAVSRMASTAQTPHTGRTVSASDLETHHAR